MHLVFVGCEYAGKSTLAGEVINWADESLGGTSHFHDHFSVPSSELAPEAQESVLAVHTQFLDPLYYGYGGPDSLAPKRSPEGQRTEMARRFESEMLARAPGTVLVLLKADPEVIRRRMRQTPHTHPIVREQDVERVLARFEEEFEASLIRRRIVLDTSAATVEQTLAEFLEAHEPFMSGEDRQRMETTRRRRNQ